MLGGTLAPYGTLAPNSATLLWRIKKKQTKRNIVHPFHTAKSTNHQVNAIGTSWSLTEQARPIPTSTLYLLSICVWIHLWIINHFSPFFARLVFLTRRLMRVHWAWAKSLHHREPFEAVKFVARFSSIFDKRICSPLQLLGASYQLK